MPFLAQVGCCEYNEADMNDAGRKTVTIPSDLAFWAAVLALVAGIAVLVAPKLANYFVAAYLIAVGLLGVLSYIRIPS